MPALRAPLAPLLLVVVAGCVPASNPFDPQTPAEEQARATLTGVVADAAGPVADVAVALITEGGVERDATTDGDGTFRIDELIAGRVAVSYTHPAHFVFREDRVLLAGETLDVDVVLVALPEGAEGSGTVTGNVKRAAEVAKPAAEQDHSGTRISIAGGDTTFSDSAGEYAFTLLPGSYDLTFSAADHKTTAQLGVVVTAGEETRVDNITLNTNPGTVSGSVAYGDGVTAGLDRITIAVGDSLVAALSDGTFALNDVEPGTFVLRASADDYATATALVVVKAGEATDVGTVTLARATGTLRGSVDLAGTPDDSGAVISIGGTTLAGTTTSTGAWSVAGIPTGSYEVRATKADFSAAVVAGIEVLADQIVDVPPLTLVARAGDFDIDGGAQFTNDPDITIEIDDDTAVSVKIAEDEADLATAASTAYLPSLPYTLLAPGDGTKLVVVEVTDAQGDTRTLRSSIVLDTAPPFDVTLAIDNGAAFTNSATGLVRLAVTAQDELSGVERMQVREDTNFVDGGFTAFSAAPTFTFATLTEEQKTLFVVVRDRAGNTSTVAAESTARITLDLTRPRGSIELNGGDDFVASPFVDAAIAQVGDDDATLMALSSDTGFASAAFQPFASAATFLLPPGEGSKVVALKLLDAAGNASTDLIQDTITLDETPPSAALLVDGGAAFTTDLTVAIDLDGDFSGARVFADGQTPGAFGFPAPTTLTLPSGDGVKLITAEAIDAAGNLTRVDARITLDTSGPALGASPVLVEGGAAFTNNEVAVVTFDVDDAAAVRIATDGAVDTEDAQPFSTNATVVLPGADCTTASAGCKSVCAIFLDAAGNPSAQRCDTITLDRTVPSTPLFVENDQVVQSASGFVFHAVAQPDDEFFDHYEVLIENRQNADSAFSTVTPTGVPALTFTISLFAPTSALSATAAEPNVVRLRAVDKAGNTSPESSLVVVVDTVNPPAPSLAPLPNLSGSVSVVNADTVSLNFLGTNAADDDATFSHYLVRTTLLPTFTEVFQRDGIIITLIPNATNVIEIKAVDAAGRQSAVSSATVCEDSEPPLSPTISPPSGAAVRGLLVGIEIEDEALDVGGCTSGNATQYEVKDGLGAGFQPQDPGDLTFAATLRPNRDNEVCVRGVDFAGNTGTEECIVISESSSSTVAGNIDHPSLSDIVGDLLLFINSSEDVVVRDLNGVQPDLNLTFGGPYHAERDHDLRGDGAGALLRVAFDVKFNFRKSPAGKHIVALFNIDLTQNPPVVTSGEFVGSGADIQGNDIAYVTQDLATGSNRVRRRAANAALPAVANDADLGIDVSGADVVLCPGTSPRVHSGQIVWCEVQGANNVLRKHVIGTATSSNTTLSTAVAARLNGSLTTDAGVQQPVISERGIAWAEDKTNDGTANPTLQVLPSFGAGFDSLARTDSLNDISGAIVGTLLVRNDLLSNDVRAILLGTSAATTFTIPVTNSLPPKSDVGVDGTRVFFRDSSTGETVVAANLLTQRWVDATLELAFDPVVSEQAIAYLSTRGGAIRLLAREHPAATHDAVEVDEPGSTGQVTFLGPAKADPTYAIGGRHVAFLVGTNPSGPFTLKVRDLVTNTLTTVSVDAQLTLAMDPDGDELVYLRQSTNDLRYVTLTGTGAVASDTSLGVQPSGVPFVDVDNGVVVFQRGGNRDNEQSGGDLFVQTSPANVRQLASGASNLRGRGPKVATTFAGTLLIFQREGSGPDFRSIEAVTCVVNTNTGQCNNLNSFAGVDQEVHVDIARDGRGVFLSGLEQSGLVQVNVIDALSLRRAVLTTIDVQRNSATIARGRLAWSDPSLGNFDVFEAVFP